MIEGKRVLVAGGAGSIGSELVRQLAPKNDIFVFDISEHVFDLAEDLRLNGLKVASRVGDIRDKSTLERVFREFEPQYIFHCAARKYVTPCEDMPTEAVSVNIEGTWNLIMFSKQFNVEKFINCSTDKVVNADCIMGATKRVSEIMVRNAGYISVRFANVIFSQGSVWPFWQRRIEHGQSVTVTDERMERWMMRIDEAVSLMVEAAVHYSHGGVYILKMGKAIRIIDLAHRLVEEVKAAGGDATPVEIIGMRPGERLRERLMTEEEEKLVKDCGKFWLLEYGDKNEREAMPELPQDICGSA